MLINLNMALLFYLSKGRDKIYSLCVLVFTADSVTVIQAFFMTIYRRVDFKYERCIVFKAVQILFLKNLFRQIVEIFVRLAFFSVMPEMIHLYRPECRIHFSMTVGTKEFMTQTRLTRKIVNPDNLAIFTVQQSEAVFDKILRHSYINSMPYHVSLTYNHMKTSVLAFIVRHSVVQARNDFPDQNSPCKFLVSPR